MPLTPIQRDVAVLLASQRTEDSYLAGGAAMHLQPQSTRFSNDLDYFHDSEERVSSAFAADRTLLETHGYTVDLRMSQRGFVRAVVTKASNSTKVEWAHDTAWRFLPTLRDPLVGFVLHPVDLAVNKLLALVGRDEPRDFLDTVETHRKVLALGALCWAAAGKDPGFTPASLLHLLRRRGRYQPQDFQRLRLLNPPNLVALKTIWLDALADAERFIAARPAEELGCLYYSRQKNTFVASPDNEPDVVPHFGRPGGVLPQIID